MENQPPKWAQKLLHWYCHPHLLEDIEGDLHELFSERIARYGLKKARRLYVWDVLRSLRPYHLQKMRFPTASSGNAGRLRSYFAIALRHFWRSKVYSFLNVTGLASGLAVSLLILLFVRHELSYDQFHIHGKRIVQMNGSFSYDGQSIQLSGLSPAVGPALQQAHPEVEAFVRMSNLDRVLVGRGKAPGQRFRENKWLLADSSFLSVFSFKLLAGNQETALSLPHSVLLTPQMARKYFGEENPLGKTLSVYRHPDPMFDKPGQVVQFTVRGIIEPAPSNSTIQYNFVASFHSLATMDKDQFTFPQLTIGNYTTFFLLASPQAIAKVETGLNKLVKPVMEGVSQHLGLTLLTDLHLHGPTTAANLKYIYIFAGVALLILLLALINYISLTTARATQRAKEIGIRKVVGARRQQVVVQFFLESLLMTFLAFLLAVALVILILPVFYHIIGLSIPVHFITHPQFLLITLAVFLGSSLIAGSYPALLLSGLIPMEALKGKFSFQTSGATLRKGFTVFQFVASLALIICSLLMQQQLNFIRHKNLGLNKEQVVVIPLEGKNAGSSYKALKEELRQQSFVQRVSVSTGVPFKAEGTNSVFTETPDKQQINVYFNNVDEQFLATFSIEWKEKPIGENLSTAANNTIILNETASSKLGISQDAVGKLFPFSGEKRVIAGVVQDFHFMSLQQSISPLALFIVPDSVEASLLNYGGYLSVKLSPQANLKETIERLGSTYRKYEQDTPFEYFFLDEAFDSLYKSQDRMMNISAVFTGFAFLISCMGLFGLSTFTAERRTKEIGIRKVLGASVMNIVILLSRDFLRMILLSFFIAVPIALYLMHRWLQEFAYRISFSWWIFALAGSVAILIALFTISFQSIKAALTNPVNSLRNE